MEIDSAVAGGPKCVKFEIFLPGGTREIIPSAMLGCSCSRALVDMSLER